MKNIETLIKAYKALNCEFEILDNLGESLYKSEIYDSIKNNSTIIETNIVSYEDKYFEYNKKNIDDYNINLYYNVTKYQNRILILKEDALTTLPNRYAIELFLSNCSNDEYITAMCDLDDFKNINDTYGHTQGDVVLREFGMILKRLLSQNIFVGRFGGEEFVMFFKGLTIKQVKEILSFIRKEMENNTELTNDKYQMKMSTGLYKVNNENLKDSIQEADMALYYVKNNGKNADAIYDKETNNCYIIE